MFPADVHDLARKVIEAYAAQKRKIVTAESCTGGLVMAALTQISGASIVIERGFVTYSNDAKIEALAVPPEMLEAYGAVDDRVAEAMAQGALEFSRADIALAVTGIAGPTGATPGKPVGLVYFGLANRSGALFHFKSHYNGDRDDIRMQAVREALRLLLSISSE
ncbi:MAG: CinA family protein [Pseudomonadota bacterium]|nr:CinA family protein [Pseudomonadota bacterium]